MLDLGASDFNSIIRVIQSSLTPIFLLTAIASLLGVLTTRLARISDQVHSLSDPAACHEDEARIRVKMAYLRRRTHVLDVAVILGAVGGASTCATALSLFLGLLRAKATASVLFVLFGAALLCTIGALMAFLFEVLLASRGIRADAARKTAHLENR